MSQQDKSGKPPDPMIWGAQVEHCQCTAGQFTTAPCTPLKASPCVHGQLSVVLIRCTSLWGHLGCVQFIHLRSELASTVAGPQGLHCPKSPCPQQPHLGAWAAVSDPDQVHFTVNANAVSISLNNS